MFARKLQVLDGSHDVSCIGTSFSSLAVITTR